MKQGIWYNIWCWWRVVRDPKFRHQNYPLNKEWDAAILRNLKDPHFEITNAWDTTSNMWITLNGKDIWVSNYPYASCRLRASDGEGMPQKTTVLKFFDVLNDHKDRGLVAPYIRGQYGT